MINVYDLKLSHPDVFKQFSVGENLIVHYKCPQAEKLVELYNHYNAIYFTLSGKKAIHIGEKSWHLTDEDALLVCRSAYSQELFENLDWEVLAFHFSDDFLKKVYDEFLMNFNFDTNLDTPKDPILSIKINSIIKASFYTLLSFFDSEVIPKEYLLELKIKELMFNILAEPKNKTVRAYFKSVHDQQKRPIWHIMESNFMFNLSIAEFARLTQRSVTAFKNEFKEFYGTSPGKWLTGKRLDYAKQQLESSKKNISEIAFNTGFENLSHFSRSFKNKYGIAPSQFRKQS
ncbi:MAG TPA: AraC family transcriptional regulator [Flavobacteriaceae bacterium]|nr:AraC family transcriptional regulator [Flavobacteriaceae bacterium]